MKSCVTSIVWCILLALSSTSVHSQSPPLNYLVITELSVPFQLVENETTSTGGIVTEIVEMMAKRTGHTLSYTVGSSDRVEKIIQYGQQQPWIAYTAKVWTGLKDFVRYLEVPLFDVRHSLLTCDSQIPDITGTSELRNRQLAILKSFDYPELTPLARLGELTLTDVRNYRQGFELVKHMRVHGFVEMDLRIKYNLNLAQAREECMRLLDMSGVIPPFYIYLAVSQDTNEEQVKLFERTLEQMRSEGAIKKIVDKYTVF